MVIKKDGRREQFDRWKLKAGILKAIEKRPVTLDQVEALICVYQWKISSDAVQIC